MNVCSLGIDTSNYTTSVAVSRGGRITEFRKKLLDVKEGERGLRQSEALFQHVARLPELMEGIGRDGAPGAVGVSTKPRDAEGSYMPCFLAGVSAASAVASAVGAPLYGFSHQRGHVAAALYSVGREDLLHGRFLAFHISGGTHELILYDGGKIDVVGRSLDISAGQLIDRVGVMTGLGFPCGAEMERLADGRLPGVRPVITGNDCNLSGFENTVSSMLGKGVPAGEAYAFVFSAVLETVSAMIKNALSEAGDVPVLLAGGVSSNKTISGELARRFGVMCAEPRFSSDNAAGIARLTELCLIGELDIKPMRS
ncbi:MAG: peptidase M22 [Clostridia bacterium]|nr:peptidase M22 [Clostridia bacterium]